MGDEGYIGCIPYARTSGPPSKTYGTTGDTCCVCGTRLSAYNPDPYCARPSCENTHNETHTKKEHTCVRKRPRRTKPPGVWNTAKPIDE